MGLIVWQPENFELLMAGSVGVVAVAALLYCCFVMRDIVSVLDRIEFAPGLNDNSSLQVACCTGR